MAELITDTVIGASIGSLITLVGMWGSNFYHSKSKKEDREHKIKTEYMKKAIDEIALSKKLISKLPNMSPEEISNIEVQGAATAKLIIIASNETVEAVSKLSASIGKYFLYILPKKIPIDNLKNKIKIISSHVDNNFQKQNIMLNEMTAFNMRKDTDFELWKIIQNNFKYHSDQIDKLLAESDDKSIQLNKLTKELVLECIDYLISIRDLEINVISSIRKEQSNQNYRNSNAIEMEFLIRLGLILFSLFPG